MTGAEQSLLSFLDTPVIVGDPEGCAAYVNPAFEERFELSGQGVLGRPLAEIFEGGGREAVLRAVAEVCQHGESVRFRVRERGVGFAAVASPIVARDARVGVVILLKEEVEGIERLLALHREIQDPLDELTASLEQLLEQTGGRRDERYRVLLEDATRAATRLRKWMDQVSAILSGSPATRGGGDAVDAAELLRNVAKRVGRDAEEAQVRLERLSAASLPRVRADAMQLEAILVRLVKDRLQQEPPLASVLLGARVVPAEGEPVAVLVAITEHADMGGFATVLSPPALAKEVLASCGGSIHCAADTVIGRTTVISLPVDGA